MLARYFFRIALIVAAVLSMVQPARADGVLSSAKALFSSCNLASGGTAFYQSSGDAEACVAGWKSLNTSYTIVNLVGFSAGSGWPSVGTVNLYSPGMGWLNNYSFYLYSSSGQSCPVNSAGTFPTCTCAANYEPSTSSFVCNSVAPPPPPPPATCSAYPVSTSTGTIGGAGDQPLQACVSHCLIDTGSGMSWGTAGARQWQSSGRSTGTACEMNTGAASSENDPACPAGQTLNASGVCTPLAVCPYNPLIYAVNVSCHPALCATDASLYASSPFCVASPAASVPAVVNCSTTPNDPVCAGAVSGVSPTITGTPGTSGVYQAPTMAPLGISGGTQTGAITINNCITNSVGVVVCAGTPAGTGESVTLDEVPNNVSLANKVVNVAITPVSVGGAGSCPAPSVMVLHGQTYYFDWTTYCNFANMIKPILLAFAWLAAAGILVGGFVA